MRLFVITYPVIGCIEDIAIRMGFIDKVQSLILADKYAKSGYGKYIKSLE
jgi:glucose-1-phosphate thymidylyltransferase